MAVGGTEETSEIPKKVTKKKGLPPLKNDSNNEPSKPRKKRKKTTDENTGGAREDIAEAADGEEKPTPRRRRKRSASQGGKPVSDDPTSPARSTSAAPRKKKKKSKSADSEPTQDGEASTHKETQGSKTSLLSKTEPDTPRKKGVKKKKKAKKASGAEDDFGDSPWAEDLRTMAEDIVAGDGKEEVEEGTRKTEFEDEAATEKKSKQVVSMISAPVLKSQPLDKIFIETSNKFRGQNKNTLARQREEEAKTAPLTLEIARTTTIDFAIATHRIFRVFTLLIHGLVAGMCVWQAASVYKLTEFSDLDFLEHYYDISMPLQCSLYFLLVLITVSVCDRFDVGNPTRRFVLRAFTMQNGTVALVFCIVALIVNIIAIRYDDKIYLYKDIPDIFSSDSERSDDIRTFRSLSIARSVFLVFSWLVLAITPNSDRLGKSLRSGETGLERQVELEKVSAA